MQCLLLKLVTQQIEKPFPKDMLPYVLHGRDYRLHIGKHSVEHTGCGVSDVFRSGQSMASRAHDQTQLGRRVVDPDQGQMAGAVRGNRVVPLGKRARRG